MSREFWRPDAQSWWDPVRALRAVTLTLGMAQMHLAETPMQHVVAAGITVVLVYWYLTLGPHGNGR